MSEFLPYVFQILSQLLELNTKDAISELYQMLLSPLMTSGLWEPQGERKLSSLHCFCVVLTYPLPCSCCSCGTGNIPPLVRLLCAYLNKAPQLIVSQGKVEGILGIFQKLVSSKATDHEGFAILNSIVLNLPQFSPSFFFLSFVYFFVLVFFS